MLALLLAPVYLVLNAYLARWLLRWMAACTHWFKKKWAVGCIMAFYIFVSLSPLTGFLITQGPVHRFLKLLGNYWLGTLAYILLTVLVLDAVRLIWKRTRWGAKGLRHPRRAFVAAGGFVILVVAGISAWGILHAQNVVLREETVTVHKACAAARQGELRIALVSDLHLGYNVGAAQVRRVVETVRHGPGVGEGSARAGHGEGCSRLASEEKEAGVLLCRVSSFLGVGGDVVEHRLARRCALMQRVDYLHGLIRVDVAVPGEAEGAERVAAHVPPLHGEEQPPVVSKNRVVYDLVYTRAGGVRAALSIRCGHRAASFVFLCAAAGQSEYRADAECCGSQGPSLQYHHLSDADIVKLKPLKVQCRLLHLL